MHYATYTALYTIIMFCNTECCNLINIVFQNSQITWNTLLCVAKDVHFSTLVSMGYTHFWSNFLGVSPVFFSCSMLEKSKQDLKSMSRRHTQFSTRKTNLLYTYLWVKVYLCVTVMHTGFVSYIHACCFSGLLMCVQKNNNNSIFW